MFLLSWVVLLLGSGGRRQERDRGGALFSSRSWGTVDMHQLSNKTGIIGRLRSKFRDAGTTKIN